jgi:hypothetical protein
MHIIVEQPYDPKVLVSATLQACRRQLLIGVAAGVLLVLDGLWLLSLDSDMGWGALFLGLVFIIVPRFRIARAALRRSPLIQATFTTELTDTEFRRTSELSSVTIDWRAFTAVKELPGFWLLMSGQAPSHVINKANFTPGQDAEFRSFLVGRSLSPAK